MHNRLPIDLLVVGALVLGLGSCDEAKNHPSGASGEDGKPAAALVITAIPDEKVSDQEARFTALKDYLATELDIPVSFSISKDYAAAVQRFANGEVHLAWFGGLTGVQARHLVPGARAIAQGAADPKFKSYFIAHASTGLGPSEDFPMAIRGLTFSFGSKSSTSGRLMPAHFIRKETGKTPEEFFAKPVQFQSQGGHVATARAVESGSVQSGVLNFKTYDTMVAEGKLDPAKAVRIWVSPEYADYNLTVHPDLETLFGEGFVDRLQDVLVACEDPAVLKAFNRDKLIPAKNTDFAGIETVARELDMLR